MTRPKGGAGVVTDCNPTVRCIESRKEEGPSIASYHFTARMVRRKEKRIVTQVAAYKFADRIECARTGEAFDYRNNERVMWTGINGPAFAPAWVQYRSVLWNAVELAETRKDAQLACE